MKTKEFRRVLNTFVFNKPIRIPRSCSPNQCLRIIIHRLMNEFLQSTVELLQKKQSEIITHVQNTSGARITGGNHFPFLEKGSHELQELLSIYTQFFAALRNFSPRGFTPKLLAIDESLSCLGNAIGFGVVMFYQEFIETRLGIVDDHAVVIVTVEGVHYFCDPTIGVCTPLYGTWVHYDAYSWYTADARDKIGFGHIVVQNFGLGVLNAILENFEFIKLQSQCPHSHDHSSLTKAQQKLSEVFHPNDAQEVGTIPWAKIREKLLPGFNDYRTDYAVELYRESLVIRAIRKNQSDKRDFEKILAQAMMFSCEHQDVLEHQRVLTSLEPYGYAVLDFIERDVQFYSQLPEKSIKYINYIRMSLILESNRYLMPHALKSFHKRLIDK